MKNILLKIVMPIAIILVIGLSVGLGIILTDKPEEMVPPPASSGTTDIETKPSVPDDKIDYDDFFKDDEDNKNEEENPPEVEPPVVEPDDDPPVVPPIEENPPVIEVDYTELYTKINNEINILDTFLSIEFEYELADEVKDKTLTYTFTFIGDLNEKTIEDNVSMLIGSGELTEDGEEYGFTKTFKDGILKIVYLIK